MTIRELQEKILRLKKEKDIYVLAHSYQAKEICEIADFVGDSYALSVNAKNAACGTIVVCGVRFMAETVKILSPGKRVVLAASAAGCPMAEQADKASVEKFKRRHPDYAVVAYINTSADFKTVCDVCVTSSSAVKIVKKMPEQNILFVPDCNLGDYISKQVPEKNFRLLPGGCPIHAGVSAQDVCNLRKQHSKALVLVHPECRPEVVALADFVGSTSEIQKFAGISDKKEFIIGTEISIAEKLSYNYPEKSFFPLSKKLICPNMKSTTLPDVCRAMNGCGGEEIVLDGETAAKARRCIEKMIDLG